MTKNQYFSQMREFGNNKSLLNAAKIFAQFSKSPINWCNFLVFLLIVVVIIKNIFWKKQEEEEVSLTCHYLHHSGSGISVIDW